MASCIIVRGIPGIGKTSLAKPLAEKLGGTYLSGDHLTDKAAADIERLLPSGDLKELEEETYRGLIDKEIAKKVNDVIDSGGHAVLDWIFLRPRDVDRIKNALGSIDPKIISLHAPWITTLNRNYKRDPRKATPFWEMFIYMDRWGSTEGEISIDTGKRDPNEVLSYALEQLSKKGIQAPTGIAG